MAIKTHAGKPGQVHRSRPQQVTPLPPSRNRVCHGTSSRIAAERMLCEINPPPDPPAQPSYRQAKHRLDRDHSERETLALPASPQGIVLFAHGSGSSRHSPRNIFVSDVLQAAGVGTLLFDLLTPAEDRNYATGFDIGLLGERLVGATRWLRRDPRLAVHPLGYFGASTGPAAALVAAAQSDTDIAAVVSRGGRPDLAGEQALAMVRAPTLLIVGGEGYTVITLNRDAHSHLRCAKDLRIVPGATSRQRRARAAMRCSRSDFSRSFSVLRPWSSARVRSTATRCAGPTAGQRRVGAKDATRARHAGAEEKSVRRGRGRREGIAPRLG